MRKVSDMIGTCTICGAEFSCYFYAPKSRTRKIMLKHRVCGRCAAWIGRTKDKKAKELIIDKKAYLIYKYRRFIDVGEVLGGNGIIRYLLDITTGEPIKSNDVWFSCDVPDIFYKGDTGGFINEREYKMIRRYGLFSCKGTTCLDRYTCTWYDIENMEKNGPVNTIPKDWVDGGERCRTYLNIDKTSKIIMEWRNRKQ